MHGLLPSRWMLSSISFSGKHGLKALSLGLNEDSRLFGTCRESCCAFGLAFPSRTASAEARLMGAILARPSEGAQTSLVSGRSTESGEGFRASPDRQHRPRAHSGWRGYTMGCHSPCARPVWTGAALDATYEPPLTLTDAIVNSVAQISDLVGRSTARPAHDCGARTASAPSTRLWPLRTTR